MGQALQRAVIYVRVSGERQLREGNGLKSQEQRCRQYAATKGYAVAAVFKEQAKSGGMMSRPQMAEMLSFIEDLRDGVVVIVDDPKRWARDVMVHFTLKEEVQKRGGRLESPSFDFQDSPIGRYMETVYAAGAELERNQNREQVRNRMQARVEMGFWPFHAPPGYVWRRHPTYHKVLALDERRSPIIKSALEGFADGRLATKVHVARYLVEQDYFGSPPSYLSQVLGCVDRILSNPMYAGYVAYPRWGVSLRKGFQPPLISLDQHQRILSRLQARERSFVRKDERDEFVLRNFVACAVCDDCLTASWSTGKTKRYAYYHCPNRTCTLYGKTISVSVMEGHFRDFLANLRCPNEQAQAIRRHLYDAWAKLAEEVERKRTERPKAIQTLANEIRALIDKLIELSNRSAISAVERRIDELERRKAQLEADGEQEVPFVGVDVGNAIEMGLAVLQNPLSAWENGSFKTKRELQRHIFAAPVRFDRNSGFGTPDLRLPFHVSTMASVSISNLVDIPLETWNQHLREITNLGLILEGTDDQKSWS